MSARFPSELLPALGTWDLNLAYVDVVSDAGVLMAKVKAFRLDGSSLQFKEPWELVAPALVEHSVVDKDRLPIVTAKQFATPRECVAVRFNRAAITWHHEVSDAGRAIVIVPRVTDNAAVELADAIDQGVKAVKPVLEKHGVPMTGRDAIDAGLAVLEQRRANKRPA